MPRLDIDNICLSDEVFGTSQAETAIVIKNGNETIMDFKEYL